MDGMPDVSGAIAAVTDALDRGLMTADPDLAAAQFTEDAVFGESNMEDVTGRTAIRDFLASANQIRTITHHKHHRDELIVLGDRAIERCHFDETKVTP